MFGWIIRRTSYAFIYVEIHFGNRKIDFGLLFDKEDAKSLLEGEKMYPCYYPTNRSVKALIKNTAIAWKVCCKEKPGFDYFFWCSSCGSVFLVRKIFGAKTIYIEVFDRIDAPTVSGKMCYLVTDVFIVEWDEMKKVYPKAVNLGSIF